MTSVSRLLEHPVTLKLGLVLAHFLWQGVVVALLVLLALVALRRARAAVRYLVFYSLFIVMAACPVMTFWTIPDESPLATMLAQLTMGPAEAGPGAVPGSAPAAVVPASPAPEPAGKSSPPERLRDLWAEVKPKLRWLAAGWAIGVALLSLRLLLQWCSLLLIVRRASGLAGDYWERLLARVSHALEMECAARLLRSSSVAAPMVMGWLRPAILLPPRVLTGLTSAQLEAVIAHELAHIRRHDYLANLVQTVVETVLFYHPAVWWLSRLIRQEREHCCDDLAVSVCGDAALYARALAGLEQFRQAAAVAASGGSLLGRVWRLLGRSGPRRGRAYGWSLAGALAVGLPVLLLVLHAATTPALATEHRLSYYLAGPSSTDPGAQPKLGVAQRRFANVKVVKLTMRGDFEPRGEGSEGEVRQVIADVLQAAGIRVVREGPADAEVVTTVKPTPGPLMRPGFSESTEWPGGATLRMPRVAPITFRSTDFREAGPSGMAVYPGWRVAKECARQSLAALISYLDPGRMRALLRADDRAVRASAFAIIASAPRREQGPPPAPLELLVQAVRDRREDVAVRMRAARGLGSANYAPRRAAEPLLAVLANPNEQPSVRASAAAALVDLAPSAKFLHQDIVDVLESPEPLIRQAAALALGRHGVYEIHDGVAYLGNSAGELDFALAGLAGRPLVECLYDPDPRVRSAALYGLKGVYYPRAAAPALLQLLEDPDPALRVGAAEPLGLMFAQTDEPPVVAALARLLRDPTPDVRKAAAYALGMVATSAAPAVPALMDLLSDPVPDVQRAAAWGLGCVGAPAAPAVPVLLGRLKRRDEESRQEVIEVLGRIGPAAKEAVPALLAAVEDEKGRPSELALTSLWQCAPDDPQVLAATLRALQREEASTRRAALEALGQTGPEVTRATAALVWVLLHDGDATCRAQAADTLGTRPGARPEAAVAALIAALRDRDPDVRAAAAMSLGAIGPTAAPAVPALRKLREGEPSQSVVVHGALAKILGEAPRARGR